MIVHMCVCVWEEYYFCSTIRVHVGGEPLKSFNSGVGVGVCVGDVM